MKLLRTSLLVIFGFIFSINAIAQPEIEMVFVEGGTFMMGVSTPPSWFGDANDSEVGYLYENPYHIVTLSSYHIGKYEVTQDQWFAIMGNNPSFFKECEKCPVENVTWFDVQDFIVKLNKMTGKNYRLPTESEWDYAARGGKYSKGFTFSGANDPITVGWFEEDSQSKTHVVGSKQNNELGAYDMFGNVMEWCSDWLGILSVDSLVNPIGPSSGQYRVVRGASWRSDKYIYSDVTRIRAIPNFSWEECGFRLVLPVNP